MQFVYARFYTARKSNGGRLICNGLTCRRLQSYFIVAITITFWYEKRKPAVFGIMCSGVMLDANGTMTRHRCYRRINCRLIWGCIVIVNVFNVGFRPFGMILRMRRPQKPFLKKRTIFLMKTPQELDQMHGPCSMARHTTCQKFGDFSISWFLWSLFSMNIRVNCILYCGFTLIYPFAVSWDFFFECTKRIQANIGATGSSYAQCTVICCKLHFRC